VAQILCFMERTIDFLFSALSVIPLDLEDERRRFKCILGFTFDPRPLLRSRPCVQRTLDPGASAADHISNVLVSGNYRLLQSHELNVLRLVLTLLKVSFAFRCLL